MSGFEVFDDVAFYFLIQSLLAIFIFPPTIYVAVGAVRRAISKTEDSKNGARPDDYESKGTVIEDKPSFAQQYFKPKYFFFGFLWLIFVYNLSQFENYKSAELATFNPVDIIGVQPDATEDEIKAAYRKLSLKWHPDKNRDNLEEAQEKFILISKAYKALTDPKTKANMDKYGNADGFQGTSVTIGLPSFLTKDENHLKILLVYFLIMILTPPICVFVWWRKAAKVHETGVLRETLANYWQLITEHMTPKFLIWVLCASLEYKVVDSMDNSDATEDDRKKLYLKVKEYMVNSQVSKIRYVMRASTLLHAYLLRIPIPESLQGELKIILKDAHRLLGVMFTVCLARKQTKASTACLELMQLITQAMWPSFNSMLQIPLLTQKEIRFAHKKQLDNIENFRLAEQEKREKLYPGHSEKEWSKINEVSNLLPNMKLDCQAAVEDEEGVYEGDIVTVTVTLTRIEPQKSLDDVVEAVEAVEEPKEKEEEEEKVVEKKKKLAVGGESEDEDSDSDDDFADPEADQRERDLLESGELGAAARVSKFGKEEHGKLVHSAFYPYKKCEKWVIMLFQKVDKTKLQFVTVQRVNDFVDIADPVQLRLRVGEKGVWPYEVHAKCDSYVGCDVSATFKIKVQKMTKTEEDTRLETFEKGKRAGLDQDDDDEEEDYEGQWYYLGHASIWELLLNVVVLGLLGLFVVNFLQTRGYWAKYVDPNVAKFWKIIAPVYNKVWPVIQPVAEPLLNGIVLVWTTFCKFVMPEIDEFADVKADL